MLTFRKKQRLIYLGIIAFLFLLTLYFTVNTITGERGLLTLSSLENNLEYNKSLLTDILLQQENLKNKISGLYEKSLSLDLLDEQAKNTLGYVSNDELMLVICTK
ncbi:MAG: septum formation initiator family protein [Wolbachia endosymbiont of Fragariocoptes setiger]|nr:septum formation initiator family protein [Wolbachia endosymbiont of Fragariocoptes setiger]